MVKLVLRSGGTLSFVDGTGARRKVVRDESFEVDEPTAQLLLHDPNVVLVELDDLEHALRGTVAAVRAGQVRPGDIDASVSHIRHSIGSTSAPPVAPRVQIPRRKGRPPGSGRALVDVGQFLDDYRQLAAKLGREPSKVEFAAFVRRLPVAKEARAIAAGKVMRRHLQGVSVSALDNFLARQGLPWPPASDDH